MAPSDPQCLGCSSRFRLLKEGDRCGACKAQVDEQQERLPRSKYPQCPSCGNAFEFLRKEQCYDCEQYSHTSAAVQQGMAQLPDPRRPVFPVIPAAVPNVEIPNTFMGTQNPILASAVAGTQAPGTSTMLIDPRFTQEVCLFTAPYFVTILTLAIDDCKIPKCYCFLGC